MLGTDLTLAYHGTAVVHGADIELAPGKVTALVGPNGSGKSTLLRALARLHVPEAGSVRLAASDERSGAITGASVASATGDALASVAMATATATATVTATATATAHRSATGTATATATATATVDALALSPRDFARRVTLLSQSHPTPSGLSVRELVEFGRHPHRGRWVRGDAEGAAIVERAMELTSVALLADKQVDQLSGGQLQRAWLACCLAQNTGVLLLDEPTTYLDLRYQIELLDLIRDLADEHGITVGVVLHDLDQAASIADHVVLLESGRVLASGTPAEVFSSELLTSAYGIRVDVAIDESTGHLTTRARGRHNSTARLAR